MNKEYDGIWMCHTCEIKILHKNVKNGKCPLCNSKLEWIYDEKKSVIHKLIVANKRIKELESPKHLREQLIKFTEETVNSYVDESTILEILGTNDWIDNYIENLIADDKQIRKEQKHSNDLGDLLSKTELENDNMQCCQNCKYNHTCAKTIDIIWCVGWELDDLKKEERELYL